ncbi:AraC family transcriptional regulator [Tatumella sp. UBA2305]|uniref:AraC family transcriptional regulator n=1 Tax=Tatumella sp. UBA2305 TaxID=1947647 RepID=UPI0025E1BC68|nr:helix-turn-helix transcriptional regulator [Tatumella sp. UBA2305]
MHDDFLAPGQSLTTVAIDYPHGAAESGHSHRCCQLIHLLSGLVRVTTPAGDWLVPPGRGVWLPARTVHSLKFTGHVRARTLFVDPLARADLPAQCQVVQITPLLRELINASLGIPAHFLSGGRDERIIELILDELRIMPILPLNLPDPVDLQLLAVCEEIKQNVAENYELEQVANQLGISGRTLSRRFQRETGLSFSDWVRRAKIIAAMNALSQGHSVLEAALEAGYDSPAAFSVMFRRILGVSPSEYSASPVQSPD